MPGSSMASVPRSAARPPAGSLLGRHRALLIITGAVIAFHLANNAVILARSGVSPVFDAHDYVQHALRISQSGPGSFLDTEERPPLPMIVSSLFFRLFGPSWKAAALGTNLICLLVLFLATHTLARLIFNDRRVGLLAGAIVTLYPAIFAHSRVVMADLPLTSTVTGFYAAVLASDSFRNRRWLPLLGLTIGAGLLTKPLFPLFVAPAFLFPLVTRKTPPAGRPRPLPWVNIAGATLIGTAVALPYYLGHLEVLRERFWGTNIPTSFATLALDPRPLLSGLANELLGPYLFGPLALLGIIACCWRHRGGLPLVLGLWVAVPLLSLSAFPVQVSRYVMPLIPPLAVATAALPLLLPRRWVSLVAVGLVLAGSVHYLALSYTPALQHLLPAVHRASYRRHPATGAWQLGGHYFNFGLYRAEPEGWQVTEIASTVSRQRRDPSTVHFVGCPAMIEYGVMLRLATDRFPVLFPFNRVERQASGHRELRVLDGDAPKIVVLCALQSDPDLDGLDQQVRSRVLHRIGSFRRVGRFPLGGNDAVTLLASP